MGKLSLTIGDVKEIEKILEQYKESANDETKAKVDELIEKLDAMEIRS